MGQERNPLKTDINRIIDLYNRGNHLKDLALKAKASNKLGLYRKYLLDISANKSQFNHRTKQLLQRVESSILVVKYSLDNQIFFSRLTNVSSQDIHDLFSFISLIHGVKINILEINEIPTFIKSSEL